MYVLVFYADGEADLLLEADLNHLQERQKFSGHGRRRRARGRHQPGAADARVSRKAHRPRSLSRVRQHAQSRFQGTGAAAIEKTGDRPDDEESESHQTADCHQRLHGDLRFRQGAVQKRGQVGRVGLVGGGWGRWGRWGKWGKWGKWG